MSVQDTILTCQEKLQTGGPDHGLFQPAGETATFCGKWLEPNKTLEFYDLRSGDTLEFKKRSEILKIKLVDETIKNLLVDTSLPLVDVVNRIGEKLHIDASQFSLQEEAKKDVWLKNNVSLPEQVKSLGGLFLLKQKYFTNQNADDPVSLHLAYCQVRDEILEGKHPLNKDEVINFAALQLQIQLGDFGAEKNVDMKNFLPITFKKKEKELTEPIVSEWRKLVNMKEGPARQRYNQLAKSLRTYGMAVFKVKEKVKDKKKLMDALLCFTRDSIIRMELETRNVIKDYKFTQLARWAATPETFTLDFGAHEEDFVVVVTQEGEQISHLIQGYIDLILRKREQGTVLLEETGGTDVATVQHMPRPGGSIAVSKPSATVSPMPATPKYSGNVSDLISAGKAIESMMADLFGEVARVEGTALSSGGLTPAQRKAQLAEHAKALQNLTETLSNLAKSADRGALNSASGRTVATIENLITCARQAVAYGVDPQGLMLAASKEVSEQLKHLFTIANKLAANPNSPELKDALMKAQSAVAASLAKLTAMSKGNVADENFALIFQTMASKMKPEIDDLLAYIQSAVDSVTDPGKKAQLTAAAGAVRGAFENLEALMKALEHVAQDPECRAMLEKAGKILESNLAFLMATAKACGLDPQYQKWMTQSQHRLNDAFAALLALAELPSVKGGAEADEFVTSAASIEKHVAAILASQNKPELMKDYVMQLKTAVQTLGKAGKAIIAGTPDRAAQSRIANYLKAVVDCTKSVLSTAPNYMSGSTDFKPLRKACHETTEAVQQLLADSGRQVALAAFHNSAKEAAFAVKGLTLSSQRCEGKLSNPSSEASLLEAARNANDALMKLILAVKGATEEPTIVGGAKRSSSFRAQKRPSIPDEDPSSNKVLTIGEEFATKGYQLIKMAKTVLPLIAHHEAETKNALSSDSGLAAKALGKMLAHRKGLKAVKGQLEAGEALEEFAAAAASLEAALVSCDTGLLMPLCGKDEALNELHATRDGLAKQNERMLTACKSAPEELGSIMKTAASIVTRAVQASADTAANLTDRLLQKAVLNSMKEVMDETRGLMQTAKAVSANPDDPILAGLLAESNKAVADALHRLSQASAGILPKRIEDHVTKASNDIESLAEKELLGAANAIQKCVEKLLKAQESARNRAAAQEISVEEQNITEAILEAARTIAQSTGVLVSAATIAQQEFQKLSKEPRTQNVYRRDPTWAEGLISAAKTVAGSVQHLVTAGNQAALGQASEEALVVAAKAVSAATTQLVTASTVKADPNSVAQKSLRSAASQVTSATDALVAAARNAAKWEEEQETHAASEKYSLPDSKIKEMEKQMEILRLEKQLEKARKDMLNARKAEYQQGVNPAFKATPGAHHPEEEEHSVEPTEMSFDVETPRSAPAPARGVARGPAPTPGRGPAPVRPARGAAPTRLQWRSAN